MAGTDLKGARKAMPSNEKFCMTLPPKKIINLEIYKRIYGFCLPNYVCRPGMCGRGVRVSVTPPIFSNLPESWSKVCHAAGELATAFSMTFLLLVAIAGQSVKTPPPPTESASAHHWYRQVLPPKAFPLSSCFPQRLSRDKLIALCGMEI